MFNNFLTKILSLFSKIFFPTLGKQALSKENRFSVEINDREVIIGKFKSGNNSITNLQHYTFNFDGVSRSLSNESDQVFYLDQIISFFKQQKVLGNEATVIVPTHETTITTVNIPLMDEETLKLQTDDLDFWKTFEELNENLDDKIISFQLLEIDDEKQEQEVLVCLADRSLIDFKNNILRNAGVIPTVFEPKCFSIINAIFKTNDLNHTEDFTFLEYGDTENYLITSSNNKFVFATNNISRADIVLIKQLEKMPDPSGPFWSEVFERSIQDIKGNLIDDDSQGDDKKQKIVKDLYVHTSLEQSAKYLEGLQTKLPEFKLKTLSLIFDGSKVKFIRKLKKDLSELNQNASKLYPLIGASLRKFNPFQVQDKNQSKFNINLYPYKKQLQNNRIVNGIAGPLNLLLILIIVSFSSIVYLKFNSYITNKNLLTSYAIINNDYNSLIEDINNVNSSVKKIENEINLVTRVTDNKNYYLNFVSLIPSLTPRGIEIQSIDYNKSNNLMTLSGFAITDYDLSIFLNNLTNEIGNPDISNVGISLIDDGSQDYSQSFNEENIPLDQITTDESVAGYNTSVTQNYIPRNKLLKLRNFRLMVRLGE